MPFYLICLFFCVAALYAAVGFGGGSTYNALLILHGIDYRILPAIALACNIIVVSGGLLRFYKEGLVAPRAYAFSFDLHSRRVGWGTSPRFGNDFCRAFRRVLITKWAEAPFAKRIRL